jgi:hypothetical protein
MYDDCVECITDDNCTGDEAPYCLNNTCVVCRNNPDCSNGTFCDGSEYCDTGNCFAGEPPCDDNGPTPLCDEDAGRCVECYSDSDCENDTFCREGVCTNAACPLNIKPRQVRINEMFRPVERWFKITGGEGFNPYADMDFSILQPHVRTAKVDKKGKLKVLVTVPSNIRLYKGLVRIRVGDCVGYVTFK